MDININVNKASLVVTVMVVDYHAPRTRGNFVLDQSARLFTFSFSTNEDAGNPKLSTKRARKYCRLLGLFCHSILIFLTSNEKIIIEHTKI